MVGVYFDTAQEVSIRRLYRSSHSDKRYSENYDFNHF